MITAPYYSKTASDAVAGIAPSQRGSGLGFVPLAAAPVYSAVRGFSISLRFQLEGSGAQVVEPIPPVVETDADRGQPARPPRAMAIDAFTAAAMRGLDRGQDEIVVGGA